MTMNKNLSFQTSWSLMGSLWRSYRRTKEEHNVNMRLSVGGGYGGGKLLDIFVVMVGLVIFGGKCVRGVQ